MQQYLLINPTRRTFRVTNRHISGPQEMVNTQANTSTEAGLNLLTHAIQEFLRAGYTCSLVYLTVQDNQQYYRLDYTYALQPGERSAGKFNLHMPEHKAKYDALIGMLRDNQGYTQEPSALTRVSTLPTRRELSRVLAWMKTYHVRTYIVSPHESGCTDADDAWLHTMLCQDLKEVE